MTSKKFALKVMNQSPFFVPKGKKTAPPTDKEHSPEARAQQVRQTEEQKR